MTMGGEPAEAREPGGPPVVKVEDEDRPLVGDGVVPLRDDVERSLARFAEAAASSPNAPPKIPTELESVLREISMVGVPYYGWGALKELLAVRMAEAVGALEKESGFHRANDGKEYAQRRDELVAGLRKFEAAPFTLQRLAEVLQNPRRQYTRTHKLINGLERLLAVSSTLPVRPRKGVVRGEGGRASVNNGSILAAAVTATTTEASQISSQASLRGVSAGVTSEGSDNGGSGNAVAVKVEELGGAAQVPIDEGKLMGHGGFTKGWESREGQGDAGQGAGRKRLKVDRTQKSQVMSE